MRLFAIALLAFLLTACGTIHHNLSGRVFDCRTHQPIAGVVVEVHETDWGMRDGGIVWDKDFTYSATTDADGKFSVRYSHGSDAKLLAKKSGYMTTQHFSEPRHDVDIGLLEGKEFDYCEKCKPLKECLETKMENGVQVTRDICEN